MMFNEDQKLLVNSSNTFWGNTHNLIKIINTIIIRRGQHFRIFLPTKASTNVLCT